MLLLRDSKSRTFVALVAVVAFAPAPAHAGLKVERVVGQPDARSAAPNPNGIDASSLSTPAGVAFDPAGNLWVADTDNNRVLGYLDPFATDAVADVVLGQADFMSGSSDAGGVSASSLDCPVGVVADAAGNLYVADTVNNRVLEFDSPFESDAVADRVFGQPDFTSEGRSTPSRSSLYYPSGVALDAAGNLWIADTANNRVLEYDDPLGAGDTVADRVLGHSDFVTNTLEDASASTLEGPYDLAFDAAGRLWVSDLGNHRVICFGQTTTGAAAYLVLGQSTFETSEPNVDGTVDAAGLTMPAGLAFDADGDLLVADYGNNRVLLFRTPSDDGTADRVLGQRNLRTATANLDGVTRKSMSHPIGIAVDAAGRVAIADGFNNRILLLAPGRRD